MPNFERINQNQELDAAIYKAVCENPGISAAEVYRLLNVKRPYTSFSYRVRRLAEAGLIEIRQRLNRDFLVSTVEAEE